jgi:cation transport regulator ChaC
MSQEHGADERQLWVFGYGSLCWLPGFAYGHSEVGHIAGYKRRFWQGNVTHRGTVGKPGRVATIVEEKNSETHGIAFQVPSDSALEYLENREVTLGGYDTRIMTTFYPKDGSREPFEVFAFMATSSSANKHWLGKATESDIADQVIVRWGNSGSNIDYVLNLAKWIRKTLPDVNDRHLFTVARLINEKMENRMEADCDLGTKSTESVMDVNDSGNHSEVSDDSESHSDVSESAAVDGNDSEISEDMADIDVDANNVLAANNVVVANNAVTANNVDAARKFTCGVGRYCSKCVGM